jgi:hypothetical protein
MKRIFLIFLLLINVFHLKSQSENEMRCKSIEDFIPEIMAFIRNDTVFAIYFYMSKQDFDSPALKTTNQIRHNRRFENNT